MYRKFFKRLLDAIFAAILILLSSPIFLVVYFLVRKNLGSPAIFSQARPGLDERVFAIYKFRTMSEKRDENGELLSDEKRLGEFGKKLRACSLDELPQLYNVLKGDMSFIGPRPLLVEYLSLYKPEQKLRHTVRPGITGLAQINGRNAISWGQKFEFDVYYAKNLSLALDLKIALLTIKKVIKKDGVNKADMATTIKFDGKN